MARTTKTSIRAAAIVAAALILGGCTPWLETKMSSAERALNCAVLSTNVPGSPTAQADACALHPATGRG